MNALSVCSHVDEMNGLCFHEVSLLSLCFWGLRGSPLLLLLGFRVISTLWK